MARLESRLRSSWVQDLLEKLWAVLQRYRSRLGERGLSAASVNLSLAALRKLTSEAAAHGGLSPLTVAGVRGVPVHAAQASGPATGRLTPRVH